MRIFLVLIFIFSLNKASELDNIPLQTLFKNNYYTYICKNRWKYINKYLGKREDLLSIVAYSCLKKHKLTLALDVAKALRFTKMGRINSSYITSLFAIKSYLIRYVEDNFNLRNITFPEIKGDDLAKVFFLTQQKLPKVSNNGYILNLDNKKIEVNYSVKSNEITLSFYDKNDNLIRKEIYWWLEKSY